MKQNRKVSGKNNLRFSPIVSQKSPFPCNLLFSLRATSCRYTAYSFPPESDGFSIKCLAGVEKQLVSRTPGKARSKCPASPRPKFYHPVYVRVVFPTESTAQTALQEPSIDEVPVNDAVPPLALVTVYDPLLSDAILDGIV